MFELKRHSDRINAGSVQVGGVFNHAGEFFVRIEVPEQLNPGANSILSISVETWRVKVFKKDEEVELGRIKATAFMGDGVND